jgi:DNA polymerase III subunit beta
VKIIVGRGLLFASLQGIFNVVPQKPTLPVLSNFLMKAEGGVLTVSGTDMDISIITSLICTVLEEGAVTVNAKRFFNIIRELPEQDVTLSSDGERVSLNFLRGDASIMGISASDYPVLKDSLEGIPVALSGADFSEMVDKTSFSVATDRSRLALTGVYWQVNSEGMSMVATDGHRLAIFEKKMGIASENTLESIVPPKTLSQVVRYHSEGVELKNVIFGKGAILFDFGVTKIFSKLIEGPYPNFRQVIPLGNSKKVYVSTDEFSDVVRRVSVLSSAVTHQIRMTIGPGEMEVTTSNMDIGGEARETLPVNYSGEPMVVAYNADFLAQILRVMDTDELVMELETPTAACIIRPVGEKPQDCYYLIMPLRLND